MSDKRRGGDGPRGGGRGPTKGGSRRAGPSGRSTRGGDQPVRARAGGGEGKPFPPREGGDRRSDNRKIDRNIDRVRGARPRDVPITPARAAEPDRIAKVMARAGLCSRRDAEEWILAGRVSVNGRVIDSPALDITPSDVVLVDGQPLPARERTRLWLHHKPPGLVTTASDPEGRPTVFDNLPAGLPRVISIGRLDINTEGLLLLTNDGGLARVLAHPSTGWLRRYRVRAYGHVTQAQLDSLKEGVTVDGIDYGPITATIDREQGDNTWLTLDLREGKNREVKEVLGALGLQVNRLIRVSFGPFQLADLKPGEVEEVPRRLLRDQLGDRLAAEAGVDLDGPRFDRPEDRRMDPAGRFDERPDKSLLKPGMRGVDARTRSPNVYRAEGDLPPRRGKRLDRDAFAEKRRKAVMGEDPALKVETQAIADRRGRTVKVERIVTEAPPAAEPREPRRRPDFKARGDAERRSGQHRFKERPPRRDGDDRRSSDEARGFKGSDTPRRRSAAGFGDTPDGRSGSRFGLTSGGRSGGFRRGRPAGKSDGRRSDGPAGGSDGSRPPRGGPRRP